MRDDWMVLRLEQTISELKAKVAELEKREAVLVREMKELQEAKDYLEGVIENSADAIVTSDLKGRITSWNKAAEKIYDFREKDVIGKVLPMVPEFLMAEEKEYIEKIKTGEIIENIETFGLKRNRTIFEISLTLSPILDPAGNVIGISQIARDLTERKRIGEDLLRKTRELSTLYFISDAMRRTLDLDRLLRIILTSVTMGDGLGFNRAILFLVDKERDVLKGMMGVGPSDYEEASQIWSRLASGGKSIKDLLAGDMPWDDGSFVDRLSKNIEIPLSGENILALTVKNKKGYNIAFAKTDAAVDPFLIQQFGTEAFAAIPLRAKDEVIGVILVDNLFTKRLITEEDMRFLAAFANQAASAIENAQLFEKIAEAEAELRNIFDSITDMVFFADTDFVIRKVNKMVFEKLKKGPEDIIGKKCYETFLCVGPGPECPHLETLRTKKPAAQEIEDSAIGGTFLISTSPFFDQSGEVVGTIHTLRDITEQKKMSERLLYSEKMAVVGEMAAKISHEIRNPLVSIGGFARRLENSARETGDKKEEYSHIIVKEVNRLEGILQSIIGFVKEKPLHIQMVEINRLIEDVISLLSEDLTKNNIIILKELSSEDIKVPVDPEQIEQAIINIINNAHQAIEKNGEIRIKTAIVEDSVSVEISDTGMGIPWDILNNIFNPFFTTKPSGIGLGLTITHRIIERHGGEIELKSKEGAGTKVIIKLPLKRTENLKP